MLTIELNLGCGHHKIPGTINIDSDESVEPDKVIDIRKEPLPFEDDSVEVVHFYHTIEHIEEHYQPFIFSEIQRVLTHTGYVLVSYPEFKIVAMNYIENKNGEREFWKHTIYGRQVRKDDYHVTLMDTDIFKHRLRYLGFDNIRIAAEAKAPYNTIVQAFKGVPAKTYVDHIKETIFNDAG